MGRSRITSSVIVPVMLALMVAAVPGIPTLTRAEHRLDSFPRELTDVATPISATPASTPDDGFPEGVSFNSWASAATAFLFYDPESLPDDDSPCVDFTTGNSFPISLELFRITLEPESDMGWQNSGFMGVSLAYILEGAIILTVDSGLERTFTGGESFLMEGGDYAIRNDGPDRAVLFQLSLGNTFVSAARTETSLKAFAVVSALDPPHTETTSDPGVTFEPIFVQNDVGDIPKAPARYVIGEATLPPGTMVDDRMTGGLLGLVVESGILSATDPESGLLLDAGSPQALVYSPLTRLQLGNSGTEPVTVLIAGVVPADGALLIPPVESTSCSQLSL